jgi:hypothetical protein
MGRKVRASPGRVVVEALEGRPFLSGIGLDPTDSPDAGPPALGAPLDDPQPVGTTHFAVSAPASATAGSAFTFTVSARDLLNNIVTNYSGTVHFTATDGQAVLPANATLNNGSGTFSATLKTAGSQSITATDTASASISGASNSIVVSAAAATHYTVSAPSSATAGTAFSFTVTAQDQFNNTATGYAGTVHFTSSDGNATLPANSTLSNGAGTFSATLRTAGARTITATDTVSAPITGTSNSISVSAAAATHFTLTAPASATANSAFNFTVTAQDQFNNKATGYAGTIHFTSSGGAAVLPANATLTNGTKAFSATLKSAGNRTLTATDTVSPLVTGTSNTISVEAAAATRFVVGGPLSALAGSAFSFGVTAFDQFNNIATGYTGTVHFTSSDGQAVLPGDGTLTNGAAVFAGTVLKTAGNRTITATDTANPALTATSSAILVRAADATHFAVTAPAVVLTNAFFSFTVTALDPFNNTAEAYSGTVHFTSSDGAAVLPLNSTLTFGVKTFNATLKTAGNRTITATDTVTASITGTSSAIAAQATKATVSGVSLGISGGLKIALSTAADGLRLLPNGRITSIPLANVSLMQILFNQAAVLTSGDVSVFGLVGGDYGPIAVAGSETQFALTFAKPVGAGDRLTLTIGNGVVSTFVRRLDVLPGDATDDGTVGFGDLVALAQHYNAAGSAAQGDFNGDGTIDFADLVTLAQNYNTSLPPVPAAPVGAAEAVASVVTTASIEPSHRRRKRRMNDR